MSRRDLEDHVWRQLSVRKHLVGRRLVDRLTRRAIRSWNREAVADWSGVASDVSTEAKADVQMGIIAAWLLSAIVNEIVHALWTWWTQSHANQCLLFGFQRELHDGDC